MTTATILQGDCIEVLKTLAAGSVQTVVTSPPYYGLRDYGTAIWQGGDPECDHSPARKNGFTTSTLGGGQATGGHSKEGYRSICAKCGAVRVDAQIGLEETPEAYVQKLVEVFREVWRVLADDGTLWLNLGDSYASANPCDRRNVIGNGSPDDKMQRKSRLIGDLKEKDLMGIPWMVAFALRADGWYLRQDIIWHKPNPMPESVRDRCTKAHEYIFLLSKSGKYYCNMEAIAENAKYPGDNRAERRDLRKELEPLMMDKGSRARTGNPTGETVNKRSVWTVTTKPYKEAHFATFPPDLIEPCILAGSRPGDTVLDPFNGSGTTGAVSLKHNRKYVGIELNPEYIKLTHRRLARVQPILQGMEQS